MKKLFALALLSLSLSSFAACEDKFPYGEPVVQGNYMHLCRRGYADIYDNQRKIPFMVFEHLTPQTIGRGQSERTPFHEDKDVPPQYRAHLKDYAQQSHIYDRGHLANAQDAQDDAAMADTMLLSNIVPQVNTFNRGSWKILETNVAKDVRRGADYYVITGSVAFKSTQVVGDGVVVPTHLFKVVVDKNANKIRAWLIPNETNNKSYKDFEINPDDLQKLLGVNLFPGRK